MKTIDFETLKRWGPCYRPEQLTPFANEPQRTPLEIATLTAGPWKDVPAVDRLWVLLREAIIPARELRLLACDFAERALTREREAGREPDARSWATVEVLRRFADGKATSKERDAAWAAARAAAGDAARAAWAAARAAGDAWAAARDARDAVGDAARAAGDAEAEWQLARTIEVLRTLEAV
jgi:hypothetical protein